MRKFVRAFDRERERKLEPGGGPMLVEVDQVYESTEHLVGRMMAAGERLEAARARGFDFADGVDPGPTPAEMLRRPGVDLADISAAQTALVGRLDAQAAAGREAAAKAAADAKLAEARKLVAEADAAAGPKQPEVPA